MNYHIEFENVLSKTSSGLRLSFIPCQENDWTPRFLQSSVLFYAVVSLVVVKITLASITLPFPQNIFFADITKTDLLALLNQSRQTIGAPLLTENKKLDQAALLKAQDMVAKGYFAHQSPQGITPWHWFRQVGYNYKYAGENLAVGFVNSNEVFRAWLNSPGHKANLYNPNYREVGTAILPGFGGNSTVIVQIFGSPQAQAKKAVSPPAVAKPPAKTTPVAATPQPLPKPIISQDTAAVAGVSQIKEVAQSAPASEAAKNPTVLGQESEIIEPSAAQSVDKSLYTSFVYFMVHDYQKLATYVLLAGLTIVSLAAFLNIVINVTIQRGRVIVTSLLLIVMLFGGLLLDQNIISYIIPHQLII